MNLEFLLGVMKYSIMRWLYNSVNILKPTELYTLKSMDYRISQNNYHTPFFPVIHKQLKKKLVYIGAGNVHW